MKSNWWDSSRLNSFCLEKYFTQREKPPVQIARGEINVQAVRIGLTNRCKTIRASIVGEKKNDGVINLNPRLTFDTDRLQDQGHRATLPCLPFIVTNDTAVDSTRIGREKTSNASGDPSPTSIFFLSPRFFPSSTLYVPTSEPTNACRFIHDSELSPAGIWKRVVRNFCVNVREDFNEIKKGTQTADELIRFWLREKLNKSVPTGLTRD